MGWKPRKLPKVNDAVAAAAAGVKVAELRIAALEFAVLELRTHSDYFREPLKEYSALHSALYKQLNDAWRHLAMWGTVHPREATRKAIGRLVWKRYLKEGMGIMGYLDPSGVPPSSWSSDDQTSFRDDLDNLADYLNIPKEDRSGRPKETAD